MPTNEDLARRLSMASDLIQRARRESEIAEGHRQRGGPFAKELAQKHMLKAVARITLALQLIETPNLKIVGKD